MKSALLILFAFSAHCVAAQFSQASRDSIAKLSAEDHAAMKKQIGIETPNRPGPSGNPSAPNAANQDESKVRNYTLPDPLVFDNGKKVSTAKEWTERRRPEIMRHFDSEVYGHLPANIPQVTWRVLAVKDTMVGAYKVKEKTLSGIVNNSSYPAATVAIELVVGTPANATQPVPVVLEFGFIRWPFGTPPAQGGNPLLSPHEPGWKEQIVSRGWG